MYRLYGIKETSLSTCMAFAKCIMYSAMLKFYDIIVMLQYVTILSFMCPPMAYLNSVHVHYVELSNSKVFLRKRYGVPYILFTIPSKLILLEGRCSITNTSYAKLLRVLIELEVVCN